MISLFVDTETTDWWKFGKDARSLEQPALLQMACVLDEDGRTIAAMSFIVTQTTWANPARVRIGKKVTDLVGIDDDSADRWGISAQIVYNRVQHMISLCDRVIAHNVVFDLGVIQQMCARLDLPDLAIPQTMCTMKLSTNVLRIPQRSGNGLKWPNLSEAYTGLTGKPLVNHHDALYDVYACRTIWKQLLARGVETE